MNKHTGSMACAAAAFFTLSAPAALAGAPLGQALSNVLGGVLPAAVGTSLPVGIGGAALITGLGLIVGVQVIKRRNDRDK